MWYHLQSVLCLNSGTRLILTSWANTVNVFNRCFSLKTGRSHWGNWSCLQEKVNCGWLALNPQTLAILAESQPPQWPTVTWRPVKRGSAWNPGGDSVCCRPRPSRCTCCARRPVATYGPPFVLSFLVSSKQVSFLLCALPSDITCALDPCLFLQQNGNRARNKQEGRKSIHRPAYFQLASNKAVNTDRNHIIE